MDVAGFTIIYVVSNILFPPVSQEQLQQGHEDVDPCQYPSTAVRATLLNFLLLNLSSILNPKLGIKPHNS